MFIIAIKVNNHTWYYTGEKMVMCEHMAKRVYSQRMATELQQEAKRAALLQFSCNNVMVITVNDIPSPQRMGTFITE